MIHTVTLAASGRSFTVRADESILAAAQRAGIALPYSCQSGVCGSCKATLVEGECAYPFNPPVALDASEKAKHQILLCQAVPRGDLVIAAREVASVADIPKRVMTLRLVDKVLLGADVARLRLLGVRGERMRRLPGQYLDVLLDDGRRRAFSIANAPHDDDAIELHVRRVAGGGFTSHVFGSMAVGDSLRVEGPLGTFVPREDRERPILMVAGGTGFAPVKALVEHFLHLGSRRPITLYWGARAADELYLRALPERWQRETATFRFEPVISDAACANGLRSGFVHEAVLEDHPDLSVFDVYMSGPPALIDAGRRLFVQANLPDDRLYYDSFDYAPDVLAELLRSRAGIHGL
ncbi:2Fe-2S iron-sulfur cluster-binding protein [Dokdonella sp.]|uniref:2Fe-2S iron-sulfur cluster-binding protein n=1 Tax=Dokdonella sp. TaxID=2291710 RepID=UPI0031B82837